jgi:hypothetical protein
MNYNHTHKKRRGGQQQQQMSIKFHPSNNQPTNCQYKENLLFETRFSQQQKCGKRIIAVDGFQWKKETSAVIFSP